MKKFFDNKPLSTIVGILVVIGCSLGIRYTSLPMLFAGIWVVVFFGVLYNLSRNTD
jgi:hypothetical protein